MTVIDAPTGGVAQQAPSSRTRVIAIIMALVGVFTALVFGVGSVAGAHSAITFNPVNISS